VKSEHKFLLETSKWVQQSSILKLHSVRENEMKMTQILVVKSSLLDHIDFTRKLKFKINEKGFRFSHSIMYE